MPLIALRVTLQLISRDYETLVIMKEVYLCSDYLKSHPLYKSFGSDSATLAKKDYPGKGYFEGKDIPSIDLVEFERKTKR